MKHLLIVGAGGFGREMFGAAREAVGYGTEFDIKGFLDARADALAGFQGYPPVVATPEFIVWVLTSFLRNTAVRLQSLSTLSIL